MDPASEPAVLSRKQSYTSFFVKLALAGLSQNLNATHHGWRRAIMFSAAAKIDPHMNMIEKDSPSSCIALALFLRVLIVHAHTYTPR